MYESITYDMILQRMLGKVIEQNPGIDTREGSIIYDAIAPAAVEVKNMYIEMDWILNQAFAGTADREHLIKRCAERGITPNLATKAILKGEFNIDVPVGSRFSLDNLNYVVTEMISTGVFKLECETEGVVGNESTGTIIPIDYVEGLTSAVLTEVLIPGMNEESDESLLDRYNVKVKESSTSGNANHYKEWAFEVTGVGGAKVFPLWNGAGTVKLVIVNTDKQPASADLITDVTQYIESVRPIGATVTITSGVSKSINITAKIQLAQGYTVQTVQDAFISFMVDKFKELAFNTAYISHAKMGTYLLGIPGVIDYQDLTLNTGTVNIGLTDEEIPILGTVSLGVV